MNDRAAHETSAKSTTDDARAFDFGNNAISLDTMKREFFEFIAQRRATVRLEPVAGPGGTVLGYSVRRPNVSESAKDLVRAVAWKMFRVRIWASA